MSRSFVLLALVACSGNSEPAPPQQPPPADAAVVPIDGITAIGSNDPSRFLDPDPVDPTRRVGQPARKPHNRPPRPIDVMLKSTPDRAIAAVDGVEIGRTPTYWYGESDGLEHTFTFTRPGYSTAIYRFVPIQSGTVHVRLELSSGQGSAAPVDPITVPNRPPVYTPADPGPLGPVDTPKDPLRPPDTVVQPGSGSGSGSSGGSKIGPPP